jgi:hypothetical protein
MHKPMHATTACVLVLALSGAGCLRDESLDINRAPIANAGDDQELEYDGEPITVTLDGSKSRDLDGTIVDWDWRLAGPNAADGGVADAGGDGASAGADLDPANKRKSTIALDKGKYTFTLWVRDDHGALSRPDTVTIKIGGDPVQECVAGAFETLDDTCRQCLCTQSDACQAAIPGCGADCWGLIGCIAVKCPTFTMDNDVACVGTNCGQFLAGGQTGAMAAGSCVSPCSAECTPSITAIVTAGGG